jgi:hypothetical protein
VKLGLSGRQQAAWPQSGSRLPQSKDFVMAGSGGGIGRKNWAARGKTH